MNPARTFEGIERPRLIRRLERATVHKVSLLAAPAGYGKTVALRQFLAERAQPVLRIDLMRDTAAAPAIARAFGRVLEPLVAGASEAVAGAIERSLGEANAHEELADVLVELLPPGDLLCAVDGLTVPLMADAGVVRFLVRLIEQSADETHWLLAARSVGDLPVASWMAYGALDAPLGETELAFTAEEAAQVAAAMGVERSREHVGELYALTHGWPTAFVLALRSAEQPERLRTVTGTNVVVFAYLAEQVFSRLDVRERELLLATCMLPAIDVALLNALSIPDAHELLDRLRKHVPFIAGDWQSGFAYQPLFRDFLEYSLRLRGEAALHAALTSAARALERVERWAAALDAYLRADAFADVERLLQLRGFELLDQGDVTRVTEAIAYLRQRERAGSSGVLALRGTLEASIGNPALSMSLFESALSAALDRRERSVVAYRYSLELIKRNDPIAGDALARVVPLLEAARSAGDLAPEFEPALAGTLAIAYSMLGRAPEAALRIGEALALVSAVDDPRLVALTYHQASYIAYVAGDAARSSRMAAAALRLAVEQRNFRLATRSCSIRFSIARGLDDDPDRAFECLTLMHEYAEKSIDRALQCEALAGMLDIAAERGDERAVRELEARIEVAHAGVDVQTTSVLPVKALVAAWEGDFRRAYDALVGTDGDQPTALRRALRLAEIALYAAAAGLREAAIEAAANAASVARAVTLRNVEDRRRYARTLAMTALTSVTIGNTGTANGVLSELERARREMSPRTRAIVEAVRAVYLRAEIGGDEPVTEAFARLRAAGFGGLARLFEALPIARLATRSSISQLTPAEIDVLRVLARGGSSTKVAAELQRSVNTVNVHVKSIMRKLRCTTRHEAIAIAREHGLVS